jgi:hypothetical protein
MYNATSHYYASKGKIETLEIKYAPANGKVHIYDKHAEDPTAPEGTFRFEVQAKHDMLETAGMRTLDGISMDASGALLRERLKKTRWDLPIGKSTDSAELIQHLDITPSKKIELLGYKSMINAGVNYGLSQRKTKELNNALRDFGIG